MGRAVNLVVSCSSRKRYETAPGLAVRELVGSDVRARLESWRKRLKTVKAEKYPAEDLYMGEHWSVARDIPSDATSHGWNVRLWICSAGYGLIRPSTRINSYQVTFAPSTIDSVANGAKDRHVLQSWWSGVCSYRIPGEQSSPRSFADLALKYPRTPLIVALSADYLNAVEKDLRGVLQYAFFRRYLSIISCGTPSKHVHWKGNLLPCDGKLSGSLGGTLTSLNARVARFLFEVQANAEPSVDRMAALVRSIETRTVAPQPRRPQSDLEVTRYIREGLKKTPLVSKTKLLEEFRGAGKACEQRRFGELYKQLKQGIRQGFHG
ncbi:hypothetical protein P8935_18515 [Telmatobacter sp. DSM 110680]|uniref:Uncharacterized protein n=1 Tax=Telmatobacter sp. DSM 110680 TaxID=3036704 RepID=A0AAU7DFY5_9BACT